MWSWPSSGTMGAPPRGITLAIRQSARWLGGCQQRPGCHSYHPPSPPALTGFLLHSTLCFNSFTPSLAFPLQGTNFSGMCARVCVCLCAHGQLDQFMCVFMAACRAEWSLSPLMVYFDASLLQQLMSVTIELAETTGPPFPSFIPCFRGFTV